MVDHPGGVQGVLGAPPSVVIDVVVEAPLRPRLLWARTPSRSVGNAPSRATAIRVRRSRPRRGPASNASRLGESRRGGGPIRRNGPATPRAGCIRRPARSGVADPRRLLSVTRARCSANCVVVEMVGVDALQLAGCGRSTTLARLPIRGRMRSARPSAMAAAAILVRLRKPGCSRVIALSTNAGGGLPGPRGTSWRKKLTYGQPLTCRSSTCESGTPSPANDDRNPSAKLRSMCARIGTVLTLRAVCRLARPQPLVGSLPA